ncbi:hypothetical protein Tco_1026310, partial [Tanacetum coccineum]
MKSSGVEYNEDRRGTRFTCRLREISSIKKFDDKDSGTWNEKMKDESETAITLIHLFILWTTAN